MSQTNEFQNYVPNNSIFFTGYDQFNSSNQQYFIFSLNQPQYFHYLPINSFEIPKSSPPDVIDKPIYLLWEELKAPGHLDASLQDQNLAKLRNRSEKNNLMSMGTNNEVRNPNKEKKRSLNDPDFKPKFNYCSSMAQQTRGRNKYSNIYRAFIKLISNKVYRQVLRAKTQKIVKRFGLHLTFEQFQKSFIQNFPTFTNYINRNQFSKFYFGNGPENLLFRVLFHDYINKSAHAHILSVSYKKKMKKQSIDDFLSALRTVHQELSLNTEVPKA